MRVRLPTTALAALAVALPHSARAQATGRPDRSASGANPHSAARVASPTATDTTPARVVQRLLDAFNRHDPAGVAAEYDTTVAQEVLGDSAIAYHVTRAQLDSAMRHDFPRMPTLRGRLLQRIVAGPYVTDLYAMTGNGPRTRHLGFYEVRRGKVVREAMYDY